MNNSTVLNGVGIQASGASRINFASEVLIDSSWQWHFRFLIGWHHPNARRRGGVKNMRNRRFDIANDIASASIVRGILGFWFALLGRCG